MSDVLFHLGGWTRYGYDCRHPDIMPANPECGGNEGLAECARRVQALGYTFSGFWQKRMNECKSHPRLNDRFEWMSRFPGDPVDSPKKNWPWGGPAGKRRSTGGRRPLIWQVTSSGASVGVLEDGNRLDRFDVNMMDRAWFEAAGTAGGCS